MVDEKLLVKIHNLFKLAEDNPNANEAKSALLMAQKLMAQNGIEQSEVHQIIKPKEILKEHITEVCRLSWWGKQLAIIIAKNFRCEIYISKTRGGGRIVFLGLKEDVQLAKMVYNFATSALIHDITIFVKQYKKRYVVYNVGIKNDFITGWVKGLDDQYTEQVNKNGWGLVLVKDPLVQQELNKIKLRKGQKSSATTGHNKNAYGKGFERGKQFSSPVGALN